jgi:hypothetical protein
MRVEQPKILHMSFPFILVYRVGLSTHVVNRLISQIFIRMVCTGYYELLLRFRHLQTGFDPFRGFLPKIVFQDPYHFPKRAETPRWRKRPPLHAIILHHFIRVGCRAMLPALFVPLVLHVI